MSEDYCMFRHRLFWGKDRITSMIGQNIGYLTFDLYFDTFIPALLDVIQNGKPKREIKELTLILLVANLANTKWCKTTRKMTETLAHGYSSESTQRELSNDYQHHRVYMVFKDLCVLVLWAKVAPALEGLTLEFKGHISWAFWGMNGSNVTMRNSHMLVDIDLLMNV